MRLLSSLLLLVAVSFVQPFYSCYWAQWNVRNWFFTLANDVINHDHDMKETCKHFKQFPSKEVFGGDAFRIEVTCSEFANAVWDIRIKHRVIYISGHYPREGVNCDLTYGDIRVLPHFANTHAASWTFKDGVFIVGFPYKYTLHSHQLTCSQDIDETLIHVRRGLPNDPIFDDNPIFADDPIFGSA